MRYVFTITKEKKRIANTLSLKNKKETKYREYIMHKIYKVDCMYTRDNICT